MQSAQNPRKFEFHKIRNHMYLYRIQCNSSSNRSPYRIRCNSSSNRFPYRVQCNRSVQPLQSNTTITNLNLADNGIGSEGAIAMADMLKDNCYITKLVNRNPQLILTTANPHIYTRTQDISDNAIGSPGAYAMAEMLKYNTTITECYLRGSHLDDKTAEIIADIIRVGLQLLLHTCVDLVACNITDYKLPSVKN